MNIARLMRCRTTAFAFDLSTIPPQQVAVVRRERVDPTVIGVERDCEVLTVAHPEVAVETTLEVGGLVLEEVGDGGVAPHRAREPGAAHLCVVRVALQINGDRLNPLSTDDVHYWESRFFLVPGTGTVHVDAKLGALMSRGVERAIRGSVSA
jgi:hypothetical protein